MLMDCKKNVLAMADPVVFSCMESDLYDGSTNQQEGLSWMILSALGGIISMKKPEETVFGAAAISAYDSIVAKDEGARLYTAGDWRAAVRLNSEGEDMPDKPCPKNTFRVLCEDGYLLEITGLDSSEPPYHGKERDYVKASIEILINLNVRFENSTGESNNMLFAKDGWESPVYIDYPCATAKQLWAAVLSELKLPKKRHHDCQMDVVLALWNAGKISSSL